MNQCLQDELSRVVRERDRLRTSIEQQRAGAEYSEMAMKEQTQLVESLKDVQAYVHMYRYIFMYVCVCMYECIDVCFCVSLYVFVCSMECLIHTRSHAFSQLHTEVERWRQRAHQHVQPHDPASAVSETSQLRAALLCVWGLNSCI